MKDGGMSAAKLAQNFLPRGSTPEDRDRITQAVYERYDPFGSWGGGKKSSPGKPEAPQSAPAAAPKSSVDIVRGL
jgi:hypothetical protein